MMECFVCGEKCQFDKVSYTVCGLDVKFLRNVNGKTLKLCPKCMRMVYLANVIANCTDEYGYPDGVFVEEETE